MGTKAAIRSQPPAARRIPRLCSAPTDTGIGRRDSPPSTNHERLPTGPQRLTPVHGHGTR